MEATKIKSRLNNLADELINLVDEVEKLDFTDKIDKINEIMDTLLYSNGNDFMPNLSIGELKESLINIKKIINEE